MPGRSAIVLTAALLTWWSATAVAIERTSVAIVLHGGKDLVGPVAGLLFDRAVAVLADDRRPGAHGAMR